MKKNLFVSVFILLFSGHLNAQLGNIGFTVFPCMCSPGGVSIAAVAQVSGATYYQWETMPLSIGNLLFDGNISPYQTATPSVNITCTMPNQYSVICVTAHNATDSSNTACDTLWGIIDVPVFAATNNPIGNPGTSGVYAVDPPTAGCPSNYIWFLIGDVTFNNGSQTINNGSAPNVNINFGPGFTSGTLCVRALASGGIVTDTVCMIINALVGINETSGPSISCYYQSSLNQVTLEFAGAPGHQVDIKIYDITGRLIHFQEMNPALARLAIATPGLKQGIYVMEVTGNNFRKTFKFGKTD